MYEDNLVIRKERKSLSNVLAYSVFILFTILTLYPLIWLFYSSFKPQLEIIRDAFALPKDPTFGNYIQAVIKGKLDKYAINSINFLKIICNSKTE